MKYPRHAAAFRAIALTALHADSSLSARLARYNAAMAKARALEAQEVAHGYFTPLEPGYQGGTKPVLYVDGSALSTN